MLDHIRDADSGERMFSIEVGNRIIFEPKKEIYQVTTVAIKHLHDDTELMRLGFDSEDCGSMQGEPKDWLLKLLIHADKVK